MFLLLLFKYHGGGGGGGRGGGTITQWIERATPGQKIVVSIPSPVPYWLGRCQYYVSGWDRSHGLCAVSVWHHIELSDVSLGTAPPDSVVADKDVEKPKKQYI